MKKQWAASSFQKVPDHTGASYASLKVSKRREENADRAGLYQWGWNRNPEELHSSGEGEAAQPFALSAARQLQQPAPAAAGRWCGLQPHATRNSAVRFPRACANAQHPAAAAASSGTAYTLVPYVGVDWPVLGEIIWCAVLPCHCSTPACCWLHSSQPPRWKGFESGCYTQVCGAWHQQAQSSVLVQCGQARALGGGLAPSGPGGGAGPGRAALGGHATRYIQATLGRVPGPRKAAASRPSYT